VRARIAVAVAFLTFLAFVYFRPLTIFFAAREAYLLAIGAEEGFARVGAHRIHYYVIGEGPPLLLVHGVASRAADAAPLFSTLAKKHRVYAPDLLGYGESDRPRDSDYSVATQTDVIRDFMDAMRLREADVIGMSMGGWTTLKLAAEHPERVKRLVLVSSAGVDFATTLDERAFSPETMDELRASFARQSDRAAKLPDFILRDFLRRGRDRQWIVRRSMASMLTRRDLLDRKLQRVRMPVLLVWGTDDKIVPFSVAASMQREMPQAHIVPLHGCGHLAIIECRGKALPEIVRFLSSQRP
jgi:pimeloyl-ACP methyl ester carboxylesterase